MLVSLYKDNSHLFNRAVSWWKRGEISHTELIFSDGVSRSSSSRDGGVRPKVIDYSKHPERWDFLEPPKEWKAPGWLIPGTGTTPSAFELDSISKLSELERNAIVYFEANKGKKYDYMGIFGQVWQAKKDSPDRLFCSESTMGALGYSEPWRFDPCLVRATLLGQGWTLRKGVDLAYRDGIPVL